MRSRNPCVFLIKSVTHTQIVNDYIRKYSAALLSDLAWYSRTPVWSFKVKRAVASRGRHRKLEHHQQRLQKTVYGDARHKLRAAISSLSKAKTFDDLYNEVEKRISCIRGVGPLYVYDISLRLGHSIGLKPTEVFLHAGALKGAQKILKPPVHQGRSTHLSSFPTLAPLAPFEIENLLCLYEDCL